jgi:DNA-binding MarR family transcriptional regulator
MTDLRRVFDDLVRFETVLWTALDARLQGECELTLSNLNVMLIVDSTPDCRVLDIAESLAITVGGTSQAVDRLEKRELCVRRAHPTDRRSSIVELTEAGTMALRQAEPIFDDELARLIAGPLSPAELTGVASGLMLLRGSATQ